MINRRNQRNSWQISGSTQLEKDKSFAFSFITVFLSSMNVYLWTNLRLFYILVRHLSFLLFPFLSFFFSIFIFLFISHLDDYFAPNLFVSFFFLSLNRIRSLFMLVSGTNYFSRVFCESIFAPKQFIIFQSIYVDKVVIAFAWYAIFLSLLKFMYLYIFFFFLIYSRPLEKSILSYLHNN